MKLSRWAIATLAVLIVFTFMLAWMLFFPEAFIEVFMTDKT